MKINSLSYHPNFEIPLSLAQYPDFLDHDSKLDTYKLLKNLLTQAELLKRLATKKVYYCGRISDDHLHAIVEKLGTNPVLNGIEKNLIKSAIEETIDE